MKIERRKPNRKRLPVIFIVCEGETERVYIEKLRKHIDLRSNVKISKARKTDALSIVEESIKIKREKSAPQDSQDEVFAVFDTENKSIDDAQKIADQEDIKTIVSSPCFEYWILLHFKKTDKPYDDCDSVGRDIGDLTKKSYKKTNASFYEEIISQYLDLAIKNAQSFSQNNHSKTNMYILVDYLKKMK